MERQCSLTPTKELIQGQISFHSLDRGTPGKSRVKKVSFPDFATTSLLAKSPPTWHLSSPFLTVVL